MRVLKSGADIDVIDLMCVDRMRPFLVSTRSQLRRSPVHRLDLYYA